ncbi:MAG: outer membrane lipoprotein-sorting protein [Bdellovibrionota bacterium]
MTIRKVFLAAAVFFLAAGPVQAEELSPKELMRQVDKANRTKDSRRTLTMTLMNANGSKRERKVVSMRKQVDENNDKVLAQFESPGDVAGTGLLTIEHDDRDDDQWLYLPALKKTRRISATDKTDSFMGTDFTYEDMSSLKLDEYEYKKLGTKTVDGVECAEIEMIPNNEKRKKESGYSKSISLVDPKRYVVLQTDYFNLKDEQTKTLRSSNINQYGGIHMPDHMEMVTHKTGHKTLLEFTNTEIDVGLKDDLFTERNLMRGR